MSKLSSTFPEEQFLAWILSKNFFRLSAKKLQKVFKTTYVSRGKVCDLVFLAWFSNIYLRVQSKNCGRNSFLIFLFRFFSDFEWNIFQTFGQKTSPSFQKLPSTCPEEQFVVWNFFLKLWTVLDFLQKPLAWFSKFYLRVQSKICGRNNFIVLPFWFFSDFERKDFQTFGQKMSRICQN